MCIARYTNMFTGQLCFVILLVVHCGDAVIHFNISADTPENLRVYHNEVLMLINKAYNMCISFTKMSHSQVSDNMRNIINSNNMTISKEFGCFMFCFMKDTTLITDAHVLNMKLTKVVSEIYRVTLRPYRRIRAIVSVLLACLMKMKSPSRQQHCELFRNLFKCVAQYEQEYGPFTVRPK